MIGRLQAWWQQSFRRSAPYVALGFTLFLAAVVPGPDSGSSLPESRGAAMLPTPDRSTPLTSEPQRPFEAPAVPSGLSTAEGYTLGQPSSSTVVPGTLPAEPSARADERLVVVSHGWASLRSGTPLAAPGVPERSLPVAATGGQHDTISFVRLGGSGHSLVLAPAQAEGASYLEQFAAVQACRIVAPGWAAVEGQAMAESPRWEPGACAAGVRADDGTWSFDLGAFPDRNDDRGFALVPGPTASVSTFRVTLQLS